MIGVNFVDTLRWFFGEIHAVAGARGSIQSRNDTVQSEHEFSSLLQFASGALGTIHVCTDCPVDLGDEIVAVGSGGMLALRGDNRLFGTRSHEQMVTEMTIPDELSSMFQGFVDPRVGPLTVLANEWVHGILQSDCQAPSFEDGMKVQEIVDSIVRSQELSRWIDTSGKKWPV
jgi:predicted dehydrogenase